MKRRDFLKITPAVAGLSLGKVPVWASNRFDINNTDENILVIVQMFGGNDGLNTIIPAENDQYYSKFRKKISVAKADTIRIGNSLSYFNPALSKGKNQGMQGLFKEGKLAVVQGVGYPDNSLSHFRSTDIWLSGQVPKSDAQRLESGWMGRFVNSSKFDNSHPTCMNIGNEASLLFQDNSLNLGISVENPKEFFEAGKDILSGDSFLNGPDKYNNEYNYLLDLSIQSNKYSKIVKDSFDSGKNTLEYPTHKLANEMKLVARLISGGLRSKVYLVSIDGFDTHSNQGGAEGKHATLLKEVSESISHFMDDLKAQNKSKNVIGLTVSEFGRRPYDNDSGGTDHGAASVMFVFGDAIKGNLYGNGYDFSNLDKNEDFKYQYDYRSVYDEILTKWFPSNDSMVTNTLGDRFKHIEGGLLRGAAGLEILATEPEFKPSVFPNPSVDGLVWLKVKNKNEGGLISIQQFDNLGRNLQIIKAIPFPVGVHEIPINLQGPQGIYNVVVFSNGQKQTLRVVKG